jgi:hypothetical protein
LVYEGDAEVKVSVVEPIASEPMSVEFVNPEVAALSP